MSFSLKELQTRRAKLVAERDRCVKEVEDAVGHAQARVSDVNARIAEVDRDIRRCTVKPVVSEHAVLRYLERLHGFDTEAVKAEILTETLEEQIAQCGSGKYPIGSGLRAVVKQKTIVSVVGESQ